MVLGEPQILAQVKQAWSLAQDSRTTGPLTGEMFQAALRTAKRVASETALGRERVSIPSVAVADFASGVFERFDDKRVLLLGAGKMAAETLRYLREAGARDVTVVNRTATRAVELAARLGARPGNFAELAAELAAADVVVLALGTDNNVAGEGTDLGDIGLPGVQSQFGVAVLAAAAKQGALIGGFHPLQLFADPATALSNLRGSSVAIEAPEPLDEPPVW